MVQLARDGHHDAAPGLLRRLIPGVVVDPHQVDWLEALDAAVRRRFRYRPESEEVIREPGWMLADLETRGFLEGDCDCIATAYASMLTYLNLPVVFVALRNSPQFDHVFCSARVAGDWLSIDPTVRPGTVYEALETMQVDV